MAITKEQTSLWSGHTLAAGTPDDTTPWQSITGAYGATVNVIIINGATGPTDPAEVVVEVANDYNSGSPNQPTIQATYKAGNTSSESYEYVIEIPAPLQAFRLIAGRNTDQDVTIDADYSEITSL